MPLPPEEENGENTANEEPKLQFSYVECLLFSFHQLGKKLPDFLIDKISAEKLKDFKIRSDLILIIKRMIESIWNLETFAITSPCWVASYHVVTITRDIVNNKRIWHFQLMQVCYILIMIRPIIIRLLFIIELQFICPAIIWRITDARCEDNRN